MSIGNLTISVQSIKDGGYAGYIIIKNPSRRANIRLKTAVLPDLVGFTGNVKGSSDEHHDELIFNGEGHLTTTITIRVAAFPYSFALSHGGVWHEVTVNFNVHAKPLE